MSDRTHFEVLHGRVPHQQQLYSSFHRPSIRHHSRTCDSQINLRTYLLCVGAKIKMLANTETSCYHPAHILKQHEPGQCLDSVHSQDLAVAKCREKNQTSLTTQVPVSQYHVVIWIPWIPSVQTSYLKVEEEILQLLAAVTKLIDLASCTDWPYLHKSPTSLISS